MHNADYQGYCMRDSTIEICSDNAELPLTQQSGRADTKLCTERPDGSEDCIDTGGQLPGIL